MIQRTVHKALSLEEGDDLRFGAYDEQDAEQIIKGFQVLLPQGFRFETRPAGGTRYAVRIERTLKGD